MSVNQNMANRDVCNVIFKDYTTKKVVFNFERANATTTELTGETTYAYGGQGHPMRIAFSGEKKGTIKIETQIQPFKLYSMMTGAAIDTTANIVAKETKTTTTEAPTITLTGTPATGSVITVFAAGTTDTEVVATLSGSIVTLTTPAPGAYDVYYTKALSTNVKKLNIKSTTFPKSFTIQMETYNVTEDEEVLPYIMTAYKAKPQPNISIGSSSTGDPATMTLTFDLLADGDSNLLDLVLIEDDQNA